MEIKRVGSQASEKGPSDWFTGTVRIDPLFQAPEPALVAGAMVTFEPGRELHGTHIRWVRRSSSRQDGVGRSAEGGPVEEIHPGDVVWFSSGREALAWRVADDGDDAHRHTGKEGRQGGRLDGTRQ